VKRSGFAVVAFSEELFVQRRRDLLFLGRPPRKGDRTVSQDYRQTPGELDMMAQLSSTGLPSRLTMTIASGVSPRACGRSARLLAEMARRLCGERRIAPRLF